MARFCTDDKDSWLWTAMIMQPEWVTQTLVADVIAQLQAKKDLPALAKMRLESYAEGLSAQIMHIGPYAEEGPTIAKLHQFIAASGHELRGKHHEIYLSDPRRTQPKKLKTVIRQPVA